MCWQAQMFSAKTSASTQSLQGFLLVSEIKMVQKFRCGMGVHQIACILALAFKTNCSSFILTLPPTILYLDMVKALLSPKLSGLRETAFWD